MKWVAPAVAVALGVVAIILPGPASPEPGQVPGTVTPPLAICPTEEGGTRSASVQIVSTAAGAGRITIFSGGGAAGSTTYESGSSGSASVPVGGIAAVGKAAGLVEFPVPETAAASLTRGTTLLSGEVCSGTPDRQVVIGAGSTTEDRIFQIHLMNPYSAEALVDVIAFSETGRESSEALRSVIVPARSSITLDLGTILPGRETLNLVVETVRGNVVTSASMESGGDQAVWRAVAPEETWYLPLPVFGGSREVVVASSTPSEVAFQVDVFGPGGLEEAAIEGTVAAGGQESVDLSGISPAALAVRVVATGPVGVFGRLTSDAAIGVATGTPFSTGQWLLPGAGAGGSGRLVLVNVGVEPAEATVTELREASRSRVVTLDPNQVIEIVLDETPSDGVSVIANGALVPLWIGENASAVAISAGYPLTPEE